MTLYEQLGGTPEINKIVTLFYQNVVADPLLAPLFPEDITPVMEKQGQFLTQFFGGPPLYTSVHGHPRMRARHLPFEITKGRADAWLSCMRRALEERVPDASLRESVLERLSHTAYFFINTEG
ncbi:globin domain-containing protein [Paenibacillus mendelii]|uniref:Globin n=1 Tax=Paenibacillus mendelii TaxID=206163 RepID=A0ABV6JKE9_9BACL|nr:globin [Paenibacillus mendelii]MCQ6558952.1 globin [Paenibacillus mendelii]